MPETVTTERDGVWLVTTRVFEDGSLSVSKLESPVPTALGAVAPYSVGSCLATNAGSGYVSYTGCLVQEASSVITLSFRADYLRASAGVAKISDVYSPYAYSFGGTITTPSLSITQSSSIGSNPATAEGKSMYTTLYSSGEVAIWLKVLPGSAWSESEGL